MTMRNMNSISKEDLYKELNEIEGDIIDSEDRGDYQEILDLRREKNLILQKIEELKHVS